MKLFSLLFLLTFLTGTAFAFLNGVLTFNGTVVIAGSEIRNWVIIQNPSVVTAGNPGAGISDSEDDNAAAGTWSYNNTNFTWAVSDLANTNAQNYRQTATFTIEFEDGVVVYDQGLITFPITNRHPTQWARVRVTATNVSDVPDELDNQIWINDTLYDHGTPAGSWFYLPPAPLNPMVPATFGFQLNTTFVPQATTRSAGFQVTMDWELLPVNFTPPGP